MDKFTKVKNIGKGNMGACALARNNEDGRYYVIKQVDLAKMNKKERQQSLNEAKVLSSLRHANVINYVDSFLARKSDHLCIVMEYADGGDLSAKIKHSHGVNFSQEQVLDWFIQCTLALHYIQSKKILHRDVKTQNIFLTQEGVCKLGDFGIARTLSNTFDQANTFVGTPYYLSPELILERPYDYASDVWALGVVLYEMMALKHPFNAADMKALMHRILKVQYEPPPSVYSNELRSIVGRMLVKDPQQRLRLSEILELPIIVRRLQQWLQGGIVPSRYVASLVRHKLLPSTILASVPGAGGDGSLPQAAGSVPRAPHPTSSIPIPSQSSHHKQQSSQQQQQDFPQVRRQGDTRSQAGIPPLASAAPLGKVNDARIAQRMRDEQAAKNVRREEISEQFRDLRSGAPKKSPTPPPFHYGGNDAPMPSRDPGLLKAEGYRQGAYVRKGSGPLSSAAQVAQQQRHLPALGGGKSRASPSLDPELSENRLAAPGHLPQVVRGSALPSANPYSHAAAVPRNVQPSVRHGAASGFRGGAGYGGQQSSGNANVQAMLERAAQQRLSRPPGAGLPPPARRM